MMGAEESARGVLTINLDALGSNYRRLKQLAGPSEVGGVVKANGYGLGVKEVGSCLYAAGCRSFFVAHPNEGVALRATLRDAAIYVLHGLAPGTEKDIADAKLIPVLNHPGELARYAAFALTRDQKLPAALQIDTGMCRLGFSPAEIGQLDRDDLDPIDLRLVISHLISAEEADNPLNVVQRCRFEQQREGLEGTKASLANSSGMFLGTDFHYDLCRPGVALYGVNPTPGKPNPMLPVVTLRAPVLQVHEIDQPGTVGYGATYDVAGGSRIATVPIGYADGYQRAAGEKATARIAGEIVPIAGRVSMDLISLDISTLPQDSVHPGCMVDLIWGSDGVDRMADASGTIGYEVLTRLGTRYARHYTRSGP
ncbi:MAG: alanine racemase [Geminicoccales bacterium]